MKILPSSVELGSQNMHYNAWGEGVLTEYSLTVNDTAAILEFKTYFEFGWQQAVHFQGAKFDL
jgi:hypothetical protein